jgi:tripartite-type tricarboxylate transporter receptor subunit TctC
MNRRHLLLAAAGGALVPAASHVARAQGAASWPDRPIRLIVPYPPAGGTDVISREIGGRLAASTGWNIVIENRPGAGGNIGIDTVAKAIDDHTIGMGQTSNLAINPTLYAANITYQPLRDLALISLVAVQPNVLVVAKNSPLRTIADVVRAAKAKPGELSAGNPGSGTIGHLATELLNRRAGVDIAVIPYRGASQVSTDLLAGRIDLYFANPLAVRGMMESGEMRALAVTSPRRASSMPEVPTMIEAGYEGFEAVNWTGLVAPARMPAPVIVRLNEEVRKALALPAVIERLAVEGAEPKPSSPEEFRGFLTSELEKWGKVVRESKVKVE